jgi:hypothetical protein
VKPDPRQRQEDVYALLKVGVPPTAIAKAFGMDPDTVKGAQSVMRVEQYGTDEIGEAMTNLIWVAYEEMLFQIEHGTPAAKFKSLQMVLARSVALAGKQTPELSEKIVQAFAEISRATAPDITLSDSIYTPTE